MTMRTTTGWVVFGAGLLFLILVPFFWFGARIESWTEHFLQQPAAWRGWTGLVLAGLLASDIFLPIPSSLASTACGMVCGMGWGTLASWMGMNVSCVIGYQVGFAWGRLAAGRLVGTGQVRRLEALSRQWGSWVVIVCRPVPVLAEASVVVAGLGRMAYGRFLFLCVGSNLVISAVYATVGALAITAHSFLLAFAGAVVLPGMAMLIGSRWRRQGEVGKAR
ncbi:MAG: hypothetical protein A2498_14720 [Lentisphaerae bacterium RIFOXYC12_FULL_60_16]|nr:MAG: hypothetical protein A2498_14720 [Lentisphaerae bacterium RIFOXYC12_FULL_60_16]OGV85701.1 MAG: hypothetical protein A2340_06565 [Lentisphaerae bacterium RIFOXYB12_FULL_60_10]